MHTAKVPPACLSRLLNMNGLLVGNPVASGLIQSLLHRYLNSVIHPYITTSISLPFNSTSSTSWSGGCLMMFRSRIPFVRNFGISFFGPPFSVRERSRLFAKNMTRWRTEPNVSINSNLFRAIRRIGKSPRSRRETYPKNRHIAAKWANPKRVRSLNYPPQFYPPFNPQAFIW